MASRLERICDVCGNAEETFSRAPTCANCTIERKTASNIVAEKCRLLELGYTIIGEPAKNSHGHRKYRLIAPCCGGEFEPTINNIEKQVKSHGKPPCLACGGSSRMSKAMLAYVDKYKADYDLEEYAQYRLKVHRLTGRTYECWKHLINPQNHTRGRRIGQFHLDHKVPIIWCFKNGIEPEVAAAAQNLQMLPAIENLQKSGKLLSDEEAHALLKESAASSAIYVELGDVSREIFEMVADTTNVWSTSTKIIVREREFTKSPLAVISRLKYACGLVSDKVGARKLTIKSVPVQDEKEFLTTWHVQGYVKSQVAIGLFLGESLMSLMTFGTPRYKQEAQYELIRFCSKGDIAVSGAASRLFSHFVLAHQPTGVVSYSLNRWGAGGVYPKLGFSFKSSNQSPSYLWRDDGKLRSWRASILRARHHKISHGGGEIVGALKVHDPGSTTWIWAPPEKLHVTDPLTAQLGSC